MKKTEDQLRQEIAELRERNTKLEALEIEHGDMEKTLMKQAHDLGERIKEINCLYGMSKLVEKNSISLERIYQRVVELIPDSWQFPDITCAQLTIGRRKYQTKNYKKTKWHQSVDIVVYGRKEGTLIVGYLEKRPKSFEGPFLEEERPLINAVAERVGRTTERKRAEGALAESEQKLKKQNLLLQEKNIALREVMNQVIMEKNELEAKVLANIDQLIAPLLNKMKHKGAHVDIEYINLLEDNINSLTSSFGSKVSKIVPKLTPRENEICNMIRNGLNSKEIAKLLNISFRSVETYRNYIRKKLGIINKKVNLAAYLDTL